MVETPGLFQVRRMLQRLADSRRGRSEAEMKVDRCSRARKAVVHVEKLCDFDQVQKLTRL